MRAVTRGRWGIPTFTVLVLLGLIGATAAPGQATQPAPDSPDGASARAALLQFRSGQHVLGFAADRMYTVGAGHALIEEFVGARTVQPLAATTAQPAANKGAPPLQSVTYPDLWDGITVSYATSAAGLTTSTYRLEPRADPDRIRLRYNTDVALQPDGSLRVQHPAAKGYFTLSAPKAWQEIGGRRVPVAVAFTQPEGRVVGFTVGDYDAAHPLLIDPTYAWHTFQGSAANDFGYDIAVDGDGNVYVTGTSDAGWGTPLHPHSGGSATNLVVMKFDSAGTLQWHTFYGSGGSAGYNEGRGIAVDDSGDVYVTGYSSHTWGAPLHPFSAPAGSTDLVVLKLDSAGALQWHTFYGSPAPNAYGSSESYGFDIAVDGSGGDVHVTGSSYATWTGPSGQAPLNAHGGSWGGDLVVLKLTGAGAYQWHTFHGSNSSYADGQGIAVDGSGNVYVAGESGSAWSGPGGASPINGFSGSWNLVVLKLTGAGAYQWHTFYRAEGRDIGIAVDDSANVYVTGFSSATWGTPLHPHSGEWDVTVIKLDSAGAYQWHTFYGSASTDDGHGIAVDGSGNVYVTGYCGGTWGAPLLPHSGNHDIVVMKLDSAGAYQWHTFHGSASADDGRGIAVDGSGNVHVAGGSWNTWGTPLAPHKGSLDIVVLKLAGDPGPGPFAFVDVTGVPVGTPQVSNSITVAGIAAPISVGVSGDASSEYAINGGAWTSAPGSVNSGDTLQVRHTSAATYGASVGTTLTIGGVSDTFTSTTTTTLTGDLIIVGTTATVIDVGGVTTVTGSLDVSGNTSATSIDMASLTTVSGGLVIGGNTSVAGLDLSSLTSAGSVNMSGNTSTGTIDVSGLTTVTGNLTIVDNGDATVDMSAGTDVGGDATIETTGTGSFAMGDGTVTGNLTLDATGYAEISGTTPGGALDVTAASLGALMHVQLPAESFTTPVTFSITRLDPIALVPESGLDANGAPATVDPVAAYQLTFAIPTLDREAALSFDIDVTQLDAATRTAILDALAAGKATMVTKGDAPGSVYRAFPICGGADVPTVDGCVKVEAFDALGLPTTGTPALIRFSNVVGHFSTWAVAIVTTTTGTLAPVVTAALSRKTHGIAGTFDLVLSLASSDPTTEPRSGGAGGNHAVVFTFDKPVTAGNASVTAGPSSAGTPTFSGNEMRVPLSGVTNQHYVTVAVGDVVAADGGTGGSGSVRIGFLLGDVNGNRVVTVSDLAQANAQIAQVVTASNYLRDVNASGTLTVADKGIANTQITKALPLP